jgi:uncharacterized protein (TIGR04222 family)
MVAGATVVVLLVVIGLGVLAAAARQRRLSAAGRDTPGELTTYQVAYLAGGSRRVAETALAYLTWANLVEARPGGRRLALVGRPREGVPLHPVERELLGRIPMEGGSPALPLSAAVAAAERSVGTPDLDLAGLVIDRRDRRFLHALVLVPALLSALGAGGLMVALAVREAPIGLLPTVPLAAAIVSATALADRSFLTRTGREALAALEIRHRRDLALADMAVTSLPIEQGLYVVALRGRPAMTGNLAPLRRVIGA